MFMLPYFQPLEPFSWYLEIFFSTFDEKMSAYCSFLSYESFVLTSDSPVLRSFPAPLFSFFHLRHLLPLRLLLSCPDQVFLNKIGENFPGFSLSTPKSILTSPSPSKYFNFELTSHSKSESTPGIFLICHSNFLKFILTINFSVFILPNPLESFKVFLFISITEMVYIISLISISGDITWSWF